MVVMIMLIMRVVHMLLGRAMECVMHGHGTGGGYIHDLSIVLACTPGCRGTARSVSVRSSGADSQGRMRISGALRSRAHDIPAHRALSHGHP